MRYFIKLSYDGSYFSGWQYQPNAVSVQECLEQTLSTLLKEPVQVVGAGRTDSKVNAIGYVAHFDYDKVIDTTAFGYKLNAILPRSVVVHSVMAVGSDGIPAGEGPHARFSATRREYTYFLHRTKDPFVEARSYFCPWDLDVDAMNEAAALLLGTHDFRCFEKVGSDNRTSICTVSEAFWTPYTPDHVAIMGYAPAALPADKPCGAALPSSAPARPLATSPSSPAAQPLAASPSAQLTAESSPAPGPLYLYFRIAADRFLRNMVRAVVGSLIEVGRGRRSVADFAALILPPDSSGSPSDLSANSPGCRHKAADGTPFRSLAGESVPGHALFLSRIDY
ncbi:MAG: tRNA pseudouridine(38-40) synthase TruA [Bacteroidales bacterium]|nr:tRNA pseudouridine(38-40) synthase TruA [Bacteroidales bacterium]